MTGLLNKSCVLLFLAGTVPCWTSSSCLAQSLSTYNISTVAGNGTTGFSGDSDLATNAQLANPSALAEDTSGTLYIADQLNHRIRKVSGGTITTFAGNGTAGYSGDNGQATSATMNYPMGLAVDASGNVYFSDPASNVVRKVTAGGVISTIAGNASYGSGGSAGDGGKATSALLNQPTAVAVDAAGNVYITDTGNNRIRVVTTDGNINTYAGSDSIGGIGDGGPATSARLRSPRGVAVDAAGNLYIADSGDHRIRMVTPDGTITTVAGNGTAGFSGDGGRATGASLNSPRGVSIDAAGNLYIADYLNSRIRKVTLNGAIIAIAGNGRFANYGDGGPAVSAALCFPADVAVDGSGNVFLTDSQNNVVRMLAPVADSLVAPTITSSSVAVLQDFGGGTAIAPGSFIEIRGTGLAGRSRAWTNSDFKNSMAPTMLEGTAVTIGGLQAFLSQVAPDRIVALVPSGVPAGSQQIVVSTIAGNSDPYAVQVSAAAPALLAPASFNVGGKQYVSALLSDGTTYAAPKGAIPRTATRPVRPGETVTLYGIGFGPVTPDVPIGRMATDSSTMSTPVQVSFGGAAATVAQAGLAIGQTAIYQFQVVVPDNTGIGAVPLTFKVGDTAGAQTLFIEVAAPSVQ